MRRSPPSNSCETYFWAILQDLLTPARPETIIVGLSLSIQRLPGGTHPQDRRRTRVHPARVLPADRSLLSLSL